MKTELVRFAYLPTVTLGRWLFPGFAAYTLEEPWRPDPDGPGGQRREGVLRESCIPDGPYDLMPHNGSVWQRVWRFENPTLGVYGFEHQIPPGAAFGRSTILGHSGVDVNSILGCVLLGMGHAFVDGRWTVVDSKIALEKMRSILVPGTRHTVIVRPTAGTQEVFP